MPPAALVSIDESFREASKPAAAKYQAGVHFGSKFMAKSWTFDNPAPGLARSEICNLDALYGLVAFDEVVANTDRKTNAGNNLVVQVSEVSPRYEYVAIDHGHILTGENWSIDGLEGFRLAPIVPIFKFLETCLVSLPSLLESARNIASFRECFEATVAAAQSDLNQEEQDAVITFLERRAAELPGWVQGTDYKAVLQTLQP
jgi:hypothetical protein